MFKINNDGFSLVELLIAAFLLSIVLYSSMSLMTQQTESVKFVETRFNQLNFLQQIKNILDDPDACKETLETKKISQESTPNINDAGDTFDQIKNKSGEVIYTKNVKYENEQVSIHSMRVVNLSVKSKPGTGVVRLKIKLKRHQGSRETVSTFSSISALVTTDNQNKITTCSTQALGLSCLGVCYKLTGSCDICPPPQASNRFKFPDSDPYTEELFSYQKVKRFFENRVKLIFSSKKKDDPPPPPPPPPPPNLCTPANKYQKYQNGIIQPGITPCAVNLTPLCDVYNCPTP